MKIVFEQLSRKISVTFQQKDIVDKYAIDKADEFLLCIDKFSKRRKINLAVLKKASLEFINVGLLTERVTKAIITGLRF